VSWAFTNGQLGIEFEHLSLDQFNLDEGLSPCLAGGLSAGGRAARLSWWGRKQIGTRPDLAPVSGIIGGDPSPCSTLG
jgi:hypothetical protein